MVICYIVDDCKFWYFFYFWRESIIVIFQDKKLFLFMNIFLNYKQFSITISIIILFSFKYWKIINLIDFHFYYYLRHYLLKADLNEHCGMCSWEYILIIISILVSISLKRYIERRVGKRGRCRFLNFKMVYWLSICSNLLF